MRLDRALTSTLAIRPATRGDAELLAGLGARLFRESFGPDNTPEDMELYLSESFSASRLSEQLAEPGAVFLLARVGESAVGYAHLAPGPAPTCVSGPDPVELVRIYVDAATIGSGCGGALMRACLERARAAGHRTLWLGVWERNERALRFYRRWGFAEVGAKDFLLGRDVQHDVVMQRPVDAP